MPALCLKLSVIYYACNYAGIIGLGLVTYYIADTIIFSYLFIFCSYIASYMSQRECILNQKIQSKRQIDNNLAFTLNLLFQYAFILCHIAVQLQRINMSLDKHAILTIFILHVFSTPLQLFHHQLPVLLWYAHCKKQGLCYTPVTQFQ